MEMTSIVHWAIAGDGDAWDGMGWGQDGGVGAEDQKCRGRAYSASDESHCI